MRLIVASFLLLLLSTVSTPGQNSTGDATFYQQQANLAYAEGNYEAFVTHLEDAHELDPGNPRVIYNLACGYALTDRPGKANSMLRALVSLRIDYGIAQDPDLKSLRALPEFQEILRRYDTALAPIMTGEKLAVLDEYAFIPEGITYDPVSNRFFLGSLRDGSIYSYSKQFGWNKFGQLTAANGPALGVAGMEVDSARNTLWLVGRTDRQHVNFDPDIAPETAVFGFDLKSGERLHRFRWRGKMIGFGFNDLTVAGDGTIYIGGGDLFVVPAGDSIPVELEVDPLLTGANGLTLSAGDSLLFVADYPRGVAVVDLITRKWEYLEGPDTLSLVGFDGLYYRGGKLIGIQNGIAPWRVVQLTLSGDHSKVVESRLLDFNIPNLVEATTGSLVGDEFYYVGREPAPDSLNGIPDQIRQFSGRTAIMRVILSDMPARK